MKCRIPLIFLFILVFGSVASATTHYVDLNSTSPTPPYTDWSTAATSIQDAIDVATNGDLVLVTNGVYSTGGISMDGSLTNRVTLNKALTVQSVNGSLVTTIQGSQSLLFPIRCAWLTNNASLIGFTLKFGFASGVGSKAIPPPTTQGGGVWGSSSNSSVVANCIITSNTANFEGGGAYQVSLQNCLISGNSCGSVGCGAYASTMNNCTVISNAATVVDQDCYGVQNVMATNCIIQFNSVELLPANYGPQAILSYCCTTPLPAGQGNFTNNPGLFSDGVHLYQDSPCIDAGTNTATGTDLFGEPWVNPPSIGCAEWEPEPLVATPTISLTTDPVGFKITVLLAAQPPFACWWTKDGLALSDDGHYSGTQTTNLLAAWVNFSDLGNYQLFVSNAFGMVMSAVVASPVIHCVNAGNTNPVSPYLTWSTAATNIQDAITVAAPGEIVLVTNGIYATGGISMDGVITNRVSINKAILVQSVNGLGTTIIQGALDPVSTNGPGAIRCAWLTNNNSILSGFTLRNGATGTADAQGISTTGGGVLGSMTFGLSTGPTNASVCNCLIESNYAHEAAGGAYRVRLNHCTITGNQAIGSGKPGQGSAVDGSGGGAYSCILNDCFVISNSTQQFYGGGTYDCILTNCALIGNSSPLNGGAAYGGSLVNCTIYNNFSGYSSSLTGISVRAQAVYSATLVNCIVFGNSTEALPEPMPPANYTNCTMSYCCSDPLPSGIGNIDADPQLFSDGIHLTAGSPCIEAGTNSVIVGPDIFGQTWANPPSIGCAEFNPIPLIGTQPAFVAISPNSPLSFAFTATGAGPLTITWSQNGLPIQDNGHFTNSATTNLLVNNFGPSDSGNYQVVVSNSYGSVTSQVVHLGIHVVDANGTNAVAPFLTWDTAATNIQDAIDAAMDGEIILVTNGLYATGGRSADGIITNRVTVDKALTVISVNGFSQTTIQGFGAKGVPLSGNGPLAVRCVWLTNGATLSGFTLQNGATRDSGTMESMSGGGVYCSTNAIVFNCVLSNNCAVNGGGIANGALNNSRVGENTGTNGAGAFFTTLNNCDVEDNYGLRSEGGAGVYNCAANNCLISGNMDYPSSGPGADNYPSQTLANGTFSYCCTDPIPSFPYNLGSNISDLTDQPIYLGFFSMATNSSTVGAGNPAFATGLDLTGHPWANPPSIGCVDVIDSELVGPLSVSISYVSEGPPFSSNIYPGTFVSFVGWIMGRASEAAWDLDGGVFPTNAGWQAVNVWNKPGTYNVTFTAYNLDNPGGVSTNVSVTVLSGIPSISATPVAEATSPNSPLSVSVNAAGPGPLTFFWTKDGASITNDGHYTNSSSSNLTVNTFGLGDAGGYQVVISNAYGSVTSEVVQLGIHAVDVNSTNPVAPYSAWGTAATTIQDAIDAALPGDIVLVTNGVYSAGGESADGVITNRVTLDKPLTVISVNGYSATTIQGAWDPATTNGPLAVRCAWLTNGASLIGFTLEGGATRATGIQASQTGGGVFGAGNYAVFNCVLTNNGAIFGGGIGYGALNNSLVENNSAVSGGGAYYATLNNCTIVNNYTDSSTNGLGGGMFDCAAYNSIISGNFDGFPGSSIVDNYASDANSASVLLYCCTEPVPVAAPSSGSNNISDVIDNPLFLDAFHIAANSPCRGAGSALCATGTDLDGESWAATPSIGCDEVVTADLVGDLSVAIEPSSTNTLVNREVDFVGLIDGRASQAAWNIDAGPVLTNASWMTAYTWSAPGTYTVTFTAFNLDNPTGVSTNVSITVSPVLPPSLQSATVAANGLQFNFPTQPGGSYEIQFTSDLTPPVTWQTVQLIVGDGNPAQITVPASGGSAGFYRIQAE